MNLSRIVLGAITFLGFVFAVFPSTLDEVRKVDPYRLVAICVFVLCVLYWVQDIIKGHAWLGGALERKGNAKVIKNPLGYQFLVEGNTCHHIPDVPTFNYLAGLYGFNWSDSKEMDAEEIRRKFTVGKQLPSITLYFPRPQDEAKKDA